MLSFSGFAPLAQSMIPMLKEESFHLGTGQDGIKRIVRAGVIPQQIIQKYINKWVPVSLDLFGVDRSSSAHWFYVWGLKGRYDEPTAQAEANLERMNEHSRELYRQECVKLVDMINKNVPAGHEKLYVPDVKFNRYIGEYGRQPYSVTGELLSEKAYEEHLREMLPQPEDVALVNEIQSLEKEWISPKGAIQ
jgi:benzoyl-CoA 2,3-epoxidase subunit B